jgi:hypothetical protein
VTWLLLRWLLLAIGAVLWLAAALLIAVPVSDSPACRHGLATLEAATANGVRLNVMVEDGIEAACNR